MSAPFQQPMTFYFLCCTLAVRLLTRASAARLRTLFMRLLRQRGAPTRFSSSAAKPAAVRPCSLPPVCAPAPYLHACNALRTNYLHRSFPWHCHFCYVSLRSTGIAATPSLAHYPGILPEYICACEFQDGA